MNTAAIRSDWIGRVVDGRFALLQWLGGSEERAVFLTELGGAEPRKAVIRLVPDENGIAESRMALWQAAEAFTHPHLMRVFHAGRCQIDDAPLLYVVSEYAEEDLSQVLPERPLTPEEAREMLASVLEALTFLHGNGYVHGGIKPSNIQVVGDRVKLSADGILLAGKPDRPIAMRSEYDAPERAAQTISPAADLWSLGITLVEALTQHPPAWEATAQSEPAVPESLPQPFAGIARECLRLDPRRRCTLSGVKTRLDPAGFNPAPSEPAHRVQAGPESPAIEPVPLRAELPRASSDRPPTRRGGTALIAVWLIAAGLIAIAVIAVVVLRSHPFRQSPSIQTPPPVTAAPAPSAPTPSPVPEGQPPKEAVVQGAVADRVLPDLLPSAVSSIRGHVAVTVRVTVDSSGNVSGATFDSAGPSRYFSRMALEAAQRWKFKPAQVNGQAASSIWLLRFQFTQSGTEVTPVEASP